jgi:glycosyltransferase involved in cell wall biosynthesis
MPERVLFLAQQTEPVDSRVPPHGSGAHVAASLAALRLSFDVLPVFAETGQGDQVAAQSKLRSLVPGRIRGLRQDLLAVVADRRFGKSALGAARGFQPDVVYARSEYFATAPLRVARALGVPLVLEVNGLLAADARTMYRSFAEPAGALIERRNLRKADAVVTVSDGLAERLVSLGARTQRLTVVPNAVPDARVTAMPRRAGESKVIGWIGHLMNWHAEALLLLADVAPLVLRRAPDVRFRIIGDGPRLAEVRDRARSRGVAHAFDFIGAVPYEEVPEALQYVDFGVIPDVFDYAFPVKLVEMGAGGLAVAAPRSRELDAMLRPDVEYLPFARRDPEALASAILELVGNNEKRDLLAAGLHQAVQARFTWSAVAAQLKRIVEDVVRT